MSTDAIYLTKGQDPDACTAGQRVHPDRCTWHNHVWCTTCEGWYGVPHDGDGDGDGIHDGLNAHPLGGPGHNPAQCACRPCRDHVAARWERRRSRPTDTEETP